MMRIVQVPHTIPDVKVISHYKNVANVDLVSLRYFKTD